MFTKKIPTGGSDIRVRTYKTVIDWGAVWGAVFIVLVVLAVIGGHK